MIMLNAADGGETFTGKTDAVAMSGAAGVLQASSHNGTHVYSASSQQDAWLGQSLVANTKYRRTAEENRLGTAAGTGRGLSEAGSRDLALQRRPVVEPGMTEQPTAGTIQVGLTATAETGTERSEGARPGTRAVMLRTA